MKLCFIHLYFLLLATFTLNSAWAENNSNQPNCEFTLAQQASPEQPTDWEKLFADPVDFWNNTQKEIKDFQAANPGLSAEHTPFSFLSEPLLEMKKQLQAFLVQLNSDIEAAQNRDLIQIIELIKETTLLLQGKIDALNSNAPPYKKFFTLAYGFLKLQNHKTSYKRYMDFSSPRGLNNNIVSGFTGQVESLKTLIDSEVPLPDDPKSNSLLERVSQGLILIPTFNTLAAEDFVNVAHVPIHFVGLVTEPTSADGQTFAPEWFFQHDIDHAFISEADSEEDFRLIIQERLTWYPELLVKVRSIDNPNLRKAVYLLLFDLTHEVNAVGNGRKALDALRWAHFKEFEFSELKEGVLQRIHHGFYGPLHNLEIGTHPEQIINEAHQWLMNTMGEINKN